MYKYLKKNVYYINMVNYKCPRCGYETHIKTIYRRHLARKILCENILSDNDLQEEYKKFNIIDKLKCQQNVNKMSTKQKKCQQNVSKMSIKNNDLLECEYCNKQFISRQGKWSHLKTCKKKNDYENNQNMVELVKLLNDQLKERDKQIKQQNDQIKELIKKVGISNSQINIQQNIKLLSYGNTDVSHLTDNDYLKCLKHSNFCIPHLIQKIHFDPKKPENHNIYISNLKNNYIMIYDGIKWVLKNRDEIIDELIDEKEIIIEQKLEEWIENGNQYPDIMKKFKRYIDKKENDRVLNKIKDEIKLMLYNNRKLIEI